MLILEILHGPDKGRRFELPDHEPQQIGRSSEALPLTDMTISRRHAELTPDNGRWLINDLHSANGTYVNGERIAKPTVLRSGDQVRTGQTIFVFGRVSSQPRGDQPIRVAGSDEIDSSVESVAPSNEDSVIMAVPDPSEAANKHLTILYQLMQLVGTTYDKQLLLERSMDLVFEHFRADRGFVLIQEGAEGKPEPVVVRYRRPPRDSDERRIMVSRTIVQHVLKKEEGVLSSNAMADKRFSSGDSVRAFGIRSAICVPIKFHERVFGVIYIDSQVANYTYTSDQLKLMTAIGALTGMALSNAELYSQGMQNARLAAVGETVASLSHSIKNILQGMRGGAEVVELAIRREDMNILRNGWTILSRNLDRIYELTMNMLAYSKQRRPEMEMVQLRTLVQEAAELVQPQCDKRNIALITEAEGDMPPIPADPSGLHQAVMNLLNNALDAVEPGEGVITLRCEYAPDTHQARITVSDNGHGINKEDVSKLFQPFYSTKGQRGTGLGLAVTRKIVDEHGGHVTVTSTPGEGTSITLNLSTESRDDPSATNA